MMHPIELAVIITAYTDPHNLVRLVEALNTGNEDFYVHIDAKVDIEPFMQQLELYRNVSFIKKRRFITWATYSQVESILYLLEEVKKSGKKYDRVLCISGTDYPLWSNKKIQNEFTDNPDKQYLCGYDITASGNRDQESKIRYYFIWDFHMKNSWLYRRLRSTMKWTMRGLGHIGIARKSLSCEIYGRKCDVWFGSDYWCLTYGAAMYVYDTMMRNDMLRKYFKYAFAPSELFVQTIMFNSEYKGQCIAVSGKTCGFSELTPLHYVEYNRVIYKYNEDDYDKLVASEKMFFRKSVTGYSDKLLDMIDKLRNG